mgnify:FL=1|tara:strand:+ start:272 stop:484 length:213 start_codon:yes stop_codon:yes gene_type:complete
MARELSLNHLKIHKNSDGSLYAHMAYSVADGDLRKGGDLLIESLDGSKTLDQIILELETERKTAEDVPGR